MKNIISKYINVEKPRRLLESDTYTNTCRHCGEKDIDLYDCETDQYWSDDGDRIVYHKCPNCGEPLEDIDFSGKDLEESDDIGSEDSIQIYMNTWKNYNEYGADLSQYGINSISDGWMSLDDAIAFCEKYAEDEPFINDYENSPIELSEYDNAPTMLQQLKEYEDCDDKEVVKAILEAGSISDISEAIEVANSGDYIWFPGVDNDSDLAHAYIDMCGGIMEAVGADRIEQYFDEDNWKRECEDDIRSLIAENEGKDYDDVTDEEIEEYQDSILADEMATAKYDNNNDFFESNFDYEAFGRDLGFDYTFVTDGAICVL